MREKSPEDILKQASRVILKASAKGRESLFSRLTAKNADKIAKIQDRKPVFYENKDGAESKILLDDSLVGLLPAEFFDSPSSWIESQPNIPREGEDVPLGGSVAELWSRPYDISKVKVFAVASAEKSVKIVSKRIDPKDLEETALARKAYEAGIPTPKVLGEILDRGNTYAFFEYIPARNLNSLSISNENMNLRLLSEEATEKGFQEWVSENLSGAPDKLPKEVRNLWLQHLPSIKIKKIISILLIFDYDTKKQINEIKKALAKDEYSFSESDIEAAVKFLGFESLDDYFNRLPNLTSQARADWAKKVHYMELPSDENFESALINLIEIDRYGFSIDEEIERLKDLCQKLGIPHKDFNMRNILVNWDYSTNRPRKPEPGEPKLYVIDWETKKSSHQDTGE